MNIFINILTGIICLLIGYIFGSISTSVWIGKLFFHKDPRDYGSHNAGGTNAGRLFGKKIGLLVIILDMFKCIAPLWSVWAFLTFAKINNGQSLCPGIDSVNNLGFNSAYLVSWPAYWLTPLGTIIGHCWPIFAKFKGGKGVSSFMGLMIASSWLLGVIPGIIYLIVLKISKYVSLSSIVAACFLTLCSWVWSVLCVTKIIPPSMFPLPMYGHTLVPSFIWSISVTFMAIIIVVKHHENIKRLKNHEERKISWMK